MELGSWNEGSIVSCRLVARVPFPIGHDLMPSLSHFSKADSSSIILIRGILIAMGSLEALGLPCTLLRTWNKGTSLDICSVNPSARSLESYPLHVPGVSITSCGWEPNYWKTHWHLPWSKQAPLTQELGAIATISLVPRAPASSWVSNKFVSADT